MISNILDTGYVYCVTSALKTFSVTFLIYSFRAQKTKTDPALPLKMCICCAETSRVYKKFHSKKLGQSNKEERTTRRSDICRIDHEVDNGKIHRVSLSETVQAAAHRSGQSVLPKSLSFKSPWSVNL